MGTHGSKREVREIILPIDSTIKILENKAANAGLLVVPVKPNGTSQECSSCGHKVKKPLSQRMHNCPVCHTSLCRDLNAAINIKNRAVGHPVLKAQSMSSKTSRCSACCVQEAHTVM